MEVLSSLYHDCPGVALCAAQVDEHEEYVSCISPSDGWTGELVRGVMGEAFSGRHRQSVADFRSRSYAGVVEALLEQLPRTCTNATPPSFEEFLALEEGA